MELWGILKSLNTAQVALIGVFATAVVTLISIILTNCHNRRNLNWQKEQWLKDNKKQVFLECLTCLSSSKPLPFTQQGIPYDKYVHGDDYLYIDNDRFLGIMDSLKRAVPLLTLAEGYCSDDGDALETKPVREKLKECIDDVLCRGHSRIPIGGEERTVRLDRGLSKAVDNSYDTIIEVSKHALQEVARGLGKDHRIPK
jgi:hypothetical protein